ncbi:MAG: M56 family metallopeptidase, partial [Oscillospiraceae bacterium]|nr:M56 family metallopeptidase [Oscillospiraceae bacterium]
IPASVNKADWPHIIAHESSHIKRLDHLLKPFAFFVLCFYWYNPLVWAAYILLGKDIEYACDEKTVKSMESDGRKAYSLALLAVSQGENILLAPPLSFGRVSAKERVKRVMNRRIPAWAVGLAVVLCASLAVLIIFTVVSADRSEADASAGADNSDPSSPEAEENVSASSDPEDLSEPSDPEEPGGMTDGSVTLYNDDGSIRCVEDYAGGWLVKRTNYLDGKVDLITEYDHWNVIRETTFGNNGEVIVWDHDETGALLTKTVYNADGDVDSIGEYTDNFLTKETTYAFGRVLYVTSYEYGPHGKPTLTSYYDRDGILSSYLVNEYDGEGRMLRESLYEADGTLHRDLIVEEFDANGNQSRWSNYIYDGEGNPTYENHFYYENGELKVDEIVHDA